MLHGADVPLPYYAEEVAHIGGVCPQHELVILGHQWCFSRDEAVGGEQVVPPHAAC